MVTTSFCHFPTSLSTHRYEKVTTFYPLCRVASKKKNVKLTIIIFSYENYKFQVILLMLVTETLTPWDVMS